MNGDAKRKELRFAPSGEIDSYEMFVANFLMDILDFESEDANSVFVSDKSSLWDFTTAFKARRRTERRSPCGKHRSKKSTGRTCQISRTEIWSRYSRGSSGNPFAASLLRPGGLRARGCLSRNQEISANDLRGEFCYTIFL